MMNTDLSIRTIRDLFTAAEAQAIPLWLESGWAIDARLGQVTREHADIDVAYPREQHRAFTRLLESLGFQSYQEQEYGFLMSKEGILLDAEPCYWMGREYNFPDFPKGSCSMYKEGRIGNFPLRCLSWDAMFVEFLQYEKEVPKENWRTHDFTSLSLITQHLTEERRLSLRRRHSQFQRYAELPTPPGQKP